MCCPEMEDFPQDIDKKMHGHVRLRICGRLDVCYNEDSLV